MFPLSKIEHILSRIEEEDETIYYEINSDYSIKLSTEFENGRLAITYIGRGYKIDSNVSYFPHDCLNIYLDVLDKLMRYIEEIREVVELTGDVDFDESEYTL